MSAVAESRPRLTILGSTDAVACEGDACVVAEASATDAVTEVSEVARNLDA